MSIRKYKAIIVFILLFFLSSIYPLSSNASNLGSSFSVSGNSVGQTITIHGSITGHECDSPDKRDKTMVDIRVIGAGGNPTGGALDFSQANFTATLNGQTLPGNVRHEPNSIPYGTEIYFDASSPFIFSPTTTVTVTINGARVVNVGDASISLLMEEKPDMYGSKNECVNAEKTFTFTGKKVALPIVTTVATTAPTRTPTVIITPTITKTLPTTMEPTRRITENNPTPIIYKRNQFTNIFNLFSTIIKKLFHQF